MENLELLEKVSQLPGDKQKEVSDFIDFLITKQANGSQKEDGNQNIEKKEQKKHPKAGCMKGSVYYMSEDFNEPLEDFIE